MLCAAAAIFFSPGPGLCTASPEVVLRPDGSVLIEARETRLEELLQVLEERFQMTIRGLEDRSDEAVTVRVEAGSVDKAMKRLIRFLNEANYVFEYNRSSLTRIRVFPPGMQASAGTGYEPAAASGPRTALAPDSPLNPGEEMAEDAAQESGAEGEERFVSNVRVAEVVEGTQAETAGLLAGDVITHYGGVEIVNVMQLLQQVKESEEQASIDIRILRDGQPLVVMLEGGYIGIKVVPHRRPAE